MLLPPGEILTKLAPMSAKVQMVPIPFRGVEVVVYKVRLVFGAYLRMDELLGNILVWLACKTTYILSVS